MSKLKSVTERRTAAASTIGRPTSPAKRVLAKQSAGKSKAAPPARSAVPPATVLTGDAAAAPRVSKKTLLTHLLQRPSGASIGELIDVSGWLPHSVRAALTGLRKEGHDIVRSQGADGAACYRIVSRG